MHKWDSEALCAQFNVYQCQVQLGTLTIHRGILSLQAIIWLPPSLPKTQSSSSLRSTHPPLHDSHHSLQKLKKCLQCLHLYPGYPRPVYYYIQWQQEAPSYPVKVKGLSTYSSTYSSTSGSAKDQRLSDLTLPQCHTSLGFFLAQRRGPTGPRLARTVRERTERSCRPQPRRAYRIHSKGRNMRWYLHRVENNAHHTRSHTKTVQELYLHVEQSLKQPKIPLFHSRGILQSFQSKTTPKQNLRTKVGSVWQWSIESAFLHSSAIHQCTWLTVPAPLV